MYVLRAQTYFCLPLRLCCPLAFARLSCLVCVCVRFHRTAAAFDLFSVGSGRRRHCGDEDGKKYIDFSSLIDFISSLAQLGLAWLGMVGSGSAVRRRRLCQ